MVGLPLLERGDIIEMRWWKLRDSVTGENTVPLDDFGCNLVTRFAVSGRMSLGRAGVAHIAILVSIGSLVNEMS